MSRRVRIITAVTLAPLAIAALLWLPTHLLAFLVAILMMAGLWEWTALAGVDRPLPRALYLVANALVMAALAWGSAGGPHLRLVPLKAVAVIGAAWWLVVPLWLRNFSFAAQPSPSSRVFKLLAGSLCVIPAWCAAVWLHSEGQPAHWSLFPVPAGARWTLFAVAIIWAADSGAYFVGSRYGRRKLAPRISPGKSWEGLAGGLVAAALLAVAAVPVLGLAWSQLPALVVLVVLTVAMSVLGDLFESLLKRHAGIKDSSDLIPGHGGMLDRVDSLLAALPVFVVLQGLLL